MQNQAKKTGELEKQIGQIIEFMAQIQEQSELSNSTIENLKEDFEIHDAITLGSAMEFGGEPKTSTLHHNKGRTKSIHPPFTITHLYPSTTIIYHSSIKPHLVPQQREEGGPLDVLAIQVGLLERF
ncbi:hypothetical protein FF2_029854 [Malus domestica]